jgi:hypothetical protein
MLSVQLPALFVDVGLLVTNLVDIRERRDRALVVRTSALIVESHEAITLEVSNWDNRSVDRQLLVVHSETVTVSVWIREQTGLEDRVKRWLDVRY